MPPASPAATAPPAIAGTFALDARSWTLPRLLAAALVVRLLAAELERDALDREPFGARRDLLVVRRDREPLALALRELLPVRLRLALLLLA